MHGRHPVTAKVKKEQKNHPATDELNQTLSKRSNSKMLMHSANKNLVDPSNAAREISK